MSEVIQNSQMSNISKYPIGIDLGTTNSCVAVWRNGKVEIIPNQKTGSTTTPSVVSFTETKLLIGEEAKKSISKNYNNTIYEAKRIIGRPYDDPTLQMNIKKKRWPFIIKKDPTSESNRSIIEIEFMKQKKTFYPEDISALVLKRMKEIAEEYLGETVTNAVITVPAYFNDAQRQATKDAGSIAELNVLRIINEPTAAAIAYQMKHEVKDDKKVLVFDLGGGTFDVSIVKLSEDACEVISTRGDTYLGGEDFDNELVDYCIEEFKKKKNIDLSDNEKVKRTLKLNCEKAKIDLTLSLNTIIEINGGGESLELQVTRAKFEDLCKEHFQKIYPCIDEALKDARLEKSEIDDIVLVGGSTRIPKIKDMVKEYFNKNPSQTIHPDEAVAYGAAYQAASIENVLDEGYEKLILVDVVPLSLGIAVGGEIMNTVIKRNTPIPIDKSQMYQTVYDNQAKALFKVYQGEREQVKDNAFLGKFIVDAIPKKKAGEVKFKVTFCVDVDSTLIVKAEEIIYGKNEKGEVDKNNQSTKPLIVKNYTKKLSSEEIKQRIEEISHLTDIQKEKDKAVKEKVKLISICCKLKGEHSDINEIYKWAQSHPDEKKEVYSEKIQMIKKKYNVKV